MSSPEPERTPRERAEDFFSEQAEALISHPRPLRMAAAAADAARKLEDTDAEAYAAFAAEVTVEVITDRLRSHMARHRSAGVRHERFARRRSVFENLYNDTVEALEAGEEPPSPLDAQYALPDRTWLRLGDMKKADLLAVSRHRSLLARSNGIEAIFLRALADRLPDEDTTVAENLTESDIVTMHDKALSADMGALPEPPDDEDTDDNPERNPDE